MEFEENLKIRLEKIDRLSVENEEKIENLEKIKL